jgi:anthranilate/para-aminobenzoate synthase component II
VRAERPVHGKPSAIEHDGQGVFAGLPSPTRGGRYNSLLLEPASIPAELVVSARSERGEVMALRHRELAIDCVQFHPESVLSEHGRQLCANWLSELGKSLVAGGAPRVSARSESRPATDGLAAGPRLAL